ncbi:MAG: acetylxylan esterase, partial [Spirochaetales bacterium]|nr:acetylxylan esterase [Spirochaetales bacterium]
RHERIDSFFRTLGYIDIQYLVNRIKGEVLMMTGLMDKICPPSTQFAAYNKITAKKEMIIYPDYGHETFPDAGDIRYGYFLDL